MRRSGAPRSRGGLPKPEAVARSVARAVARSLSLSLFLRYLRLLLSTGDRYGAARRGDDWRRLSIDLGHLKQLDERRAACAAALADEHVRGEQRADVIAHADALARRKDGGGAPAAKAEAAAVGSEKAAVGWACAACTYLNAAGRAKCEMCATRRPAPPDDDDDDFVDAAACKKPKKPPKPDAPKPKPVSYTHLTLPTTPYV